MYANSAVFRAGAWVHWLYNILLVSLLVNFTQSALARELIPGSRNPGIWASNPGILGIQIRNKNVVNY